MGLDIVELFMDVEREFDIEIPNRDAEQLGVLGDLANYVSGVLVLRGEPNDPDAVWRRLVEVVERFGIEPRLITRSAHVVDDLGLD